MGKKCNLIGNIYVCLFVVVVVVVVVVDKVFSHS